MAETGLTRLPVVERDGSRRLVGMVALEDLLKARTHNLEAERRRERILPVRLSFHCDGVKGRQARGTQEQTGPSGFQEDPLAVHPPYGQETNADHRHRVKQ